MKKEYIQPAMRVVALKHQTHILAGSYGPQSYSINSNLGEDDFDYAGGGNGEGR